MNNNKKEWQFKEYFQRNFRSRKMMEFYLLTLLLLLQIANTKLDRVNISSNLQKWKPNSDCNGVFYHKNNKWNSPTCGIQTKCVLSTEYFKTEKIREITITIKLAFMKNSNDLLLKVVKRKTANKDVDRKVVAISKNSPDGLFFKTLSLENYKGLVLQFNNSEGFCGNISSLAITYSTCTQAKKSLAQFENHSAPSIAEKPIRILGKCKNNSEPDSSEIAKICFSNGSVKNRGSCLCIPGFYLKDEICEICPRGFYKELKGNQACIKCGTNSYNDRSGTKCSCKVGTYRLRTEARQYSSTCYSSKPRHFELISISSKTAYIKWQQHQLQLNTGDMKYYKISCLNCNSKEEGKFPLLVTTNYVKITMLQPNKLYFITIAAIYENMPDSKNNKEVLEAQFQTTDSSKIETYITITIILVVVFVVGSCIVIACLYIYQKRIVTSFLQKVSSIKRSQRLTRPPSTTESIQSEINPYAIYNEPGIPKSIGENNMDIGIYNEQYGRNNVDFGNNTDAYVSMSAETRRRHHTSKDTSHNHYVRTPKIPQDVKEVHLLEKRATDQMNKNIRDIIINDITPSFIERQRQFSRETYNRRQPSSYFNSDESRPNSFYIGNDDTGDYWTNIQNFDNRLSNVIFENETTNIFHHSDVHINQPIKEFRTRHRSATVSLQPKPSPPEILPRMLKNKTESCILPKDFIKKQIDELKFDKNYRCPESKQDLYAIPIPKRPRSADDVHRIMTEV